MTVYDASHLAPDSLTGAIAAIEGVRDAAVLLNGPTGCKFYHGAVCENQLPRADSLDPLYYGEEFYFGQPRVPVTYLDDYDYVFGATAKLEKILPVVAGKGHSLIGVINSPGAALIGDDLLRFIDGAALPVPCVAIENTGFSRPLSHGFEQAVMAMFSTLSPRACDKKRRSINLLGLSIFHRHWEGNLMELTRLLGACGVGVNAAVCAGCSVSDLENIMAAQVNVVVHGEYARDLVPFLKQHFDMETLVHPGGAPVGFDATAGWIKMVCRTLGVNPDPALDLIRQARQRSHQVLNRFNALTGLPKGAGFAVEADASLALPLTTWLYDYLGMVPVAIRVDQGMPEQLDSIRAFLHRIDCCDAWQADMATATPDVVLASGASIASLRLAGFPFVGIETALPSLGYMHVIPRADMGVEGALYFVEQIINGLSGYSLPSGSASA